MFFTKDHEWINIEGDTGVIGISSYAVGQLGDITYLEIPKVSSVVNKGKVFCTVESVKAASDIYAPVSGEITEVNAALETNPEIVNQSPEEKGWICKIKISNKNEIDGLMNQDQYAEFIKNQ